ncbi:MAG: DUF2845 domain-containing protein [Curvibacter sp.]|nr:DUF2845 domain-containing protein [Curvibacter sp.]
MEFQRAAAACALGMGWMVFQAHADTMTCGRDFAQLGDSKAEVTLKCGAPVATDQYCKKAGNAGGFSFNGLPAEGQRRESCEWVDEWTYRPESGQFITKLRFENGRLAAIVFGDRVP